MDETQESGAFGAEIGWGDRPALLLVDMVDAYFIEGSPLFLDKSAVVDHAARLLECARAAAIPVVHTVVRYAADMSDAAHFGQKVPALRVFRDGAPEGLGGIVTPLEPTADEVVLSKQFASAFFGTSLASLLTARGVDTVVVAGVSTSGCVRATTTDALQHGFRPMLVSAACGDRTDEFHDDNVRDLGAKYADVVAVTTACEHMQRTSGWTHG